MTPHAPVDEYEYVEMYEAGRSTSGKTAVYTVRNRNHGDRLGVVSWYGPWRQYVFKPASPIVLSAGCLRDIASFVDQATNAHRTHHIREKGEG